METKFNTIEEILEDLRQGKIVMMMDDEDRENEGDVICAAEHAGWLLCADDSQCRDSGNF